MISFRKFKIVGFELGKELKTEISLDVLFKKEEDSELIYSLQEEIESILDMGINETLFIDLSRDNIESKGIILRIR